MDGHLVEVIGIIFLIIFAITMFYHGWHIFYENGGYSRMNTRRDLERMRQRVEELLKEKTNEPD